MHRKSSIIKIFVAICLCIIIILSFLSIVFVFNIEKYFAEQEYLRTNAYEYNIDHAIKLSDKIDVDFNEYIDFSKFQLENGKRFIEANYNNMINEENTDRPLRVYKYFCDESIVFTDSNNNYFYTNTEDNLYYYMKIRDDNSSNFYIKKDYVFPCVTENKVINLLVYEKIDAPEILNCVSSDDFSQCIRITNTEAIQKAIDTFNSGDSNYIWLREFFNYSSDRDYLVLAQFENSVFYQTIGRIAVDIDTIKPELKITAWKDLCQFRNSEEWDIDNCVFITTEKYYKVIFFDKDNLSSYCVKLDKKTLKITG